MLRSVSEGLARSSKKTVGGLRPRSLDTGQLRDKDIWSLPMPLDICNRGDYHHIPSYLESH